MPQVSIIIPAYKADAFIAKAVGSVLAQSLQDVEIVIASDDGQDYLEVLAAQGIKDKRIRMVSTGGVATGMSSARNTAMRAAASRIIGALDADDMLAADALEIMLPLAQAHGAVYSDVRFTEFATGRELPNYNRPVPAGPMTLGQILTSNLHAYAWVMFDRERLPDIAWRERVVFLPDMVFFADCCDRLGQMYYANQPLYVYRHRDGSMCNRPETPKEFQEDLARIATGIRDGTHKFRHAETARLLLKHVERWDAVERMVDEGIASGKYKDFQEFLRQHHTLFYQKL